MRRGIRNERSRVDNVDLKANLECCSPNQNLRTGLRIGLNTEPVAIITGRVQNLFWSLVFAGALPTQDYPIKPSTLSPINLFRSTSWRPIPMHQRGAYAQGDRRLLRKPCWVRVWLGPASSADWLRDYVVQALRLWDFRVLGFRVVSN